MIRARNVWRIGLAVALLSGGAARAMEEQPLTNSDVIKLTRLDLGDVVVIAKIKSAKDVRFELATDDLVMLRQAGVSKEVIAAMLERVVPQSPVPPARTSEPKVVLKTLQGSTTLAPTYGTLRQVFFSRVAVFQEAAADVRTRDRRLVILLSSDRDPRQVWWLVRLDPDEDDEDRSLGVEQLRDLWDRSCAPNSDDMVQFDAVEATPGSWTITPRRDLVPGEYGMYICGADLTATLYDFGVDR